MGVIILPSAWSLICILSISIIMQHRSFLILAKVRLTNDIFEAFASPHFSTDGTSLDDLRSKNLIGKFLGTY